MKKGFVFFALFLIISSGYSQNPPATIGVGIVTERIDSIIVKQIKVINTRQSNIIAFPAEYSQRRNVGVTDTVEQHTYFTPDSITLMKMNEALKSQYCDAKRYRATTSYNHMIKLFGKEWGQSYIKEQKQSMKKELDFINKNCDQKKADLDSIDKQVIAFISNKYKGKVLFIQLCDFRDDPYKLRESAKKQMIDGWHGWFETNLETFYYNIGQNKLSVHGGDF
jgi:hypothetical protein